jgi:hypothetical protein
MRRLSPGDLDAIGDRLRDIESEDRKLRARLLDQVREFGGLLTPHYQFTLNETSGAPRLRLAKIQTPAIETTSLMQSSLQQWTRLTE